MTPSARIAAAIDVVHDIETRRRPASDSLKDWGTGHRFAGSKDRAAIASLVYDALRCRSSSAWSMGADTPRASMLGALRRLRGLDLDAIGVLFSGATYAPSPITDDERERLLNGGLDDAPAHVRGDYPEWLAASFVAAFGADAALEGAALSRRAPLDLRVNTLKADRDKAAAMLAHLNAEPTPHSPVGLRIPLGGGDRNPSVQAEPAWVKGFVEVQDEGSQVATLLAGARPGEQVLDLCAGGGGKSLALAALTGNSGQIYATDTDGRRLMPIYERIERSGARNIQVRPPRGTADVVADLRGKCDLVLVDAPCTGTGTWRRNPDAKWRMRPGALEQRVRTQDEILATASNFVKAGGRLAYVTCSVLIEENESRVAAFLAGNAGFAALDPAECAAAAGLPELAGFASRAGAGLRLSPRTAGTDGFFVGVLVRRE